MSSNHNNEAAGHVPSIPAEGHIAIQSGVCALVFGFGLATFFLSETMWHVGAYMVFLGFFHWCEYMLTAVYNHPRLSLDSFLLNHSPAYHAAAVAAWAEFALEYMYAPEWKQASALAYVGLLLAFVGEATRVYAMITAKHNFSHIVQFQKAKGHVLVTNGIYGLARHPAYMGWFLFSVSTQLLLQNPVCLVAYAVVSWRFFNERIHDEEIGLLSFFGKDYINYQKSVWSGVPFVKGYILSEEEVRKLQ